MMVANQIVQVLAATRNERIYELLRNRDDLKYEIALHTGTIKDLLPQSQLIVIDYEDIIAYPLSEAEIRGQISAARVHECSSQEFAGNPDHYLRGLGSTLAGKMLSLPQTYLCRFRLLFRRNRAYYDRSGYRPALSCHNQAVSREAQKGTAVEGPSSGESSSASRDDLWRFVAGRRHWFGHALSV